MPTPDEIARIQQVVTTELRRVRDMRYAAAEAVKVAEQQSAILLYKERVPIAVAAEIMGISPGKFYSLLPSDIPGRNNYPPGRHRQQPGVNGDTAVDVPPG
jgi:hypothetical protein